MISSRTGALSLSIACLFSLAALPAQKVQLKDALPEGSAAYLSFPNLSSSIAELRQMPVGKMWQEGEVQDFFADGLKWLEDRWKEHVTEGNQLHEAGKLPLKPENLLGLRVESASLGITSVTLTLPEGWSEPMVDFGLYVLLDLGDSAATCRQIFEALLAQARVDGGDDFEESTSLVGEVEVLTIQPKVPGLELSLNVAFVGDSVLIGSRKDETRQVLENLVSGKKGLSASAAYTEVSENLNLIGAETELYFRPGMVIDLLLDVVGLASTQLDADAPKSIRSLILNPAGIERAITELGLRAYQSCGSSATYTDGRCVTRSYSRMDPQLRRGLTTYTESNLDLDFLRWVPKDAVQFSASTFSLRAYYDALVKGLEAFDPELRVQVMGMLKGFEEQLDVNLRDDLFGSFGERFITWSMPMSGMGAAPEMAILIEIKDEQKLMKALQAAETMSQGLLEIDEIDRRGFKAYQIHFNLPNSAGMIAFNPLDLYTPTFVFEDGFMVVGFTTGDVKRTLKRMAREDDPNGDIRSNEEFAPYLEKLPKQGLSSVSFTDWKAQFEGFYQMATSLLAFVPMDPDIPIDLALLPDSYSLTQHLFGSISWVQSSEDRQETMTISPWGPETTTALGFLLGAGVSGGLFAAASFK